MDHQLIDSSRGMCSEAVILTRGYRTAKWMLKWFRSLGVTDSFQSKSGKKSRRYKTMDNNFI